MKPLLIKPLLLSLCISATTLTLTGCGGADTTINEKDPIASEEGDDHNHGGGVPNGVAAGRLLVVNPTDTQADVFDLADNDLITTVALDAVPSAVHATGGFRFAALVERSADTVGFIDGGLFQEPHDDHFDTFMQMPALSNFTLTGSRPTHFVTHEGQSAVFLDGDAATGANAGVQILNDSMIERAEAPATVTFSMSMHGVAEPRGEHLITSLRREDAQSTSANTVLPDQVGVYQRQDGEYTLEQTFDVTCPDLHGAAQNENHIVFGCSDGVLLVTDNGNDTFSAQKIPNSDAVAQGLRIGSLWGHHDSAQFIGQASSRTSDTIQFFAINPVDNTMALIDWQPETDATPVSRSFAYEAEQFVILDDKGYLSVIEPNDRDGQTLWEFGEKMLITDADLSQMPEGMRLSMTTAQNAHIVYVADPIAQHIRKINVDMLMAEGDIELTYAPAMITWLGIAQTHSE